MADIKMNVNETLELDSIIQKWTPPTDLINVSDGGSEGSDFDLEGLKTNTAIFNPKNSGTYTLNINNSELIIEVEDSINIPESRTWDNPNIADFGGLSRDNTGNTIDDDTSTYAVLKSGANGYIEFSPSGEYKAIRLDFNNTIGKIDVYLKSSGDVLKENWDVSGNPYYVISLKDILGKSNYKTSENFVIQVDDNTNKRIAEVDIDTNV